MIKNEKGSVTLVVAVTVLFLIVILSSSLMLVSIKRKSQLQESKILQEIYGGEDMNTLYQEQLEKLSYSNSSSASISASEITSDLYGKYIDIGLDINNNNKTTDDWEIFYAGNDRIFLIAADYVPTSKLETWNVIGESSASENNGFTKYDGNYCVNWPSEPTKFVDLPTEPTNFLSLVMHTKYDLNNNSSNNNSKAVSYLLDTTAWKGIKEASEKSDSIDFVIGGPTLEMWCAAWNKAIEGDETNGFVIFDADPQPSSYGYKVKTAGTTSQYWAYMDGTENSLSTEKLGKLGTTYKTFFPHTESDGYNGCYGYWLASPSANYSDCLMYVLCYGCVSRDNVRNYNRGVRPVVCLKSETNIAWDSEIEMFKLTSSPSVSP